MTLYWGLVYAVRYGRWRKPLVLVRISVDMRKEVGAEIQAVVRNGRRVEVGMCRGMEMELHTYDFNT